MSRLKITFTNNSKISKDVIDTLNKFHFKNIYLTNDSSENDIVLYDEPQRLFLRTGTDDRKFHQHSIDGNCLKEIEDEFRRYTRRGGELIQNRVLPSSKHHYPFVDRLSDQLEKQILTLTDRAPDKSQRPFGVIMSHDVDGIGKFYLGSLKSAIVFFFNFLRSWKRPKVALYFLCKSVRFFSGSVDYFGFPHIIEVAERYSFKPLFFFFAYLNNSNNLTFTERIKGVNPNYRLEEIKEIIDLLKESGAEIGLHGSYRSASDISLLKEEKRKLEGAFNIKCTSVRQHYLNFHGGLSLENYSKIGIEYDCSCGIVYENGFFCGTCRPFYFRASSGKRITIIPMIFMDAVNIYFRPCSPTEIRREIDSLLNTLKRHGGVATFNFHQRMISAIPDLRDIYAHLASQTLAMGGSLLTPGDLDSFYGNL